MKKISYITISLSLLLLISIFFNIEYLNSLSRNNNLVKKADTEFLSKLDSLNTSLKFFKENQQTLAVNVRNSSSHAGSVLALCKLTSFYNKNIGLFGTLNELTLVLIDLPEDKILKNIDKISDYLVKIYNNPTGSNISDEFQQFLFELKAST